ncbi:hypothetical protein D3C80_1658290 [compost metagenome]
MFEANAVEGHPHIKVAGRVLIVEFYGLVSPHEDRAVFAWDDDSLDIVPVDECHLAAELIRILRDTPVSTPNCITPVRRETEVVEATGDHPVRMELLTVVVAFDSIVDSRESVLVADDFANVIFDLLLDILHGRTSSVDSSSGWYCQRNASLKIRGSSGR